MKNLLKLSVLTLTVSFICSELHASTDYISQSGTSNARVITPLTVTATTALEFGNLAASANAGTIDQAGSVTGGVTAVTGGATRAPGVFTVAGEASASTPYTFTLPSTATLTSGANSMTATLSYASGTSSRTLSSGSDTVTINGVLAVAANQASGAYTGTYTVTANY